MNLNEVELTSRACSLLSNLGIPEMKKSVREAIKAGRIKVGCFRAKGYSGKKTILNLYDWSGYHPPLKYPDGLRGIKRPAKRTQFKCRHCGEWNEPPFLHTRIAI